MRDAVQKSDAPIEKKERLFALINEMQLEVDLDRTPIHAIGELWLTICTYMGEGFKKLEPAARFAERICGALGIAKSLETSRLPPPPKQIEGPKSEQRSNVPKRIETSKSSKKNGFDKAVDDDLPF